MRGRFARLPVRWRMDAGMARLTARVIPHPALSPWERESRVVPVEKAFFLPWGEGQGEG